MAVTATNPASTAGSNLPVSDLALSVIITVGRVISIGIGKAN